MNPFAARIGIDKKSIAQAACTATLAFVLSSVFMPGVAETQTRTCIRLERQLASLSKVKKSVNPLRLLKFNTAIKRQKDQIKRTKRQLRRNSCSGGIFGTARRGSSCRTLNRSLKKMETNLAKLRAQRNKYKGRASSSRERRRIQRAIAANRCNEPRRPVIANNRRGVIIERRGDRRSIIDQIYGRNPYEREPYSRERRRGYDEYDPYNRQRRRGFPPYDEYGNEPEYGTRYRRAGTYRTMCVRACDGYYFPISFSTTPSNFDRDIQACLAKSPGVDVELYYFSTNQEPEDMISVASDEPYRSLPTAFNYRTVATPNCGRNSRQAGITTIAGDEYSSTDTAAESSIIATPTSRIDPGEDPETLANARGFFVPKPLTIKKDAAKSKKRKVRVVGEAFFPTQ